MSDQRDERIRVRYSMVGEDGSEMDLGDETMSPPADVFEGYQSPFGVGEQGEGDSSLVLSVPELMVILSELEASRGRYANWLMERGRGDAVASDLVARQLGAVSMVCEKVAFLLRED